MKTTITRIAIAAAVLVLAAGALSAQTLQAQIPFSFRAGDKLLPAGNYTVYVKNTSTLVILSNFEAKQSAAVLPGERSEAAKEWRATGTPVLAFECTIGRCALIRLWAGQGSPALSMPHRSLDKVEHASLTLIPLTRAAD
ncbi:MAG TPA: hypothetical protein VMJ75_00845 [Candidatus Acidoferrales bacterium]|nr:hypothetical protein [Candidatus Acidoferrales bacterium]